MEKTKICPGCGKYFSFEITTGRHKEHCSVLCREDQYAARRKLKYAAMDKCKTDGCNGKASRVSYGLCECCYYRLRRTGTTTKVERVQYRYITSSGYIKLRKPEHPIAEKSGGHIFEHRYVAYEAAKGICPECYWCGKRLDWNCAVVDHLNENKQDNQLINLVVSCNDCNRSRGSILSFVKRMKAESVDVFCSLVRGYNKAQRNQ